MAMDSSGVSPAGRIPPKSPRSAARLSALSVSVRSRRAADEAGYLTDGPPVGRIRKSESVGDLAAGRMYRRLKQGSLTAPHARRRSLNIFGDLAQITVNPGCGHAVKVNDNFCAVCGVMIRARVKSGQDYNVDEPDRQSEIEVFEFRDLLTPRVASVLTSTHEPANDRCAAVARVIRRLARVEEAYARELDKLVAEGAALSREGTFGAAWTAICDLQTALARIHENLSISLKTQTLDVITRQREKEAKAIEHFKAELFKHDHIA
eukprot:369058_1